MSNAYLLSRDMSVAFLCARLRSHRLPECTTRCCTKEAFHRSFLRIQKRPHPRIHYDLRQTDNL